MADARTTCLERFDSWLFILLIFRFFDVTLEIPPRVLLNNCLYEEEIRSRN
jgi:hypothetical protein